MTTEDDFQQQLDAHLEDWQTRLVFADWLQERDDVRADGYRALGALNVYPLFSGETEGRRKMTHGFTRDDNPRNHFDPSPKYLRNTLPRDWYELLAPNRAQEWWSEDQSRASRREAEDAAALAFARLPAERRAELLNANGVNA